MKKRVTIILNDQMVEKAKQYSRRRGISLSKLIENYFNYITDDSLVEEEITPLVESMTGMVPYVSNEDQRMAYTNYLIEKYK